MRSMTRRAAAFLLSSLFAGSVFAQAPVTPTGTAPAPATGSLTSATKPEPRPTGTAAKVNGQEIPEVAVWRALRQFPMEERDAARKEILNHLTENTLIDQYLVALKVEIPQKEVEELVVKLTDELKKAGKDYTKELEMMMLTETEFRAEVLAQMKWDKFLKDQATDAKLKDMFDKAPTMFDGSMVRASHILMTAGTQKEKEDAAGKLRGIKKVLEDESAKVAAALPATSTPLQKDEARNKKVMELFAAYAKEYSTCPSKKEGGDLNFFPRVGAMVEPFAKAAFDMKVGDVSDVIATEFGYHLVVVTAKQPGKQPTFEQAKEAVRAVYAMRLRDAVIAQQKPAAKIDVTATSAVSGTTGTSPAK